MVSLVASVRDASAEGGRGPELGIAAPLDPATSERAPVVWKRTWVDERPAMYGVAGEGLPVVILHGWGLAHHAYKGAIQRLVAQGCRVYAPAQPGFGGTAELPEARVLARRLRAVGRTLPRGRAHRRARLPDRPLVRWRGRDPVRVRLPRACALTRARQLDRRVRMEGGLEAQVTRGPSPVGLGSALPERHVADPAGHEGHPDHARRCAAEPAAQPSSDAQGGVPRVGESTSPTSSRR